MAIDCVLCFRDDSGSYFVNPYITLLSIFKNTEQKINVHILHDSTIEHGKKHLEDLCLSHGHNLHFHQVPQTLDVRTAEAVSKRFNLGATYLYYAHEFVPAAKAVYLDCDVVVNRDILDLYDLPLGNRLFASTPDHGPYWKNGRPGRQYKKTIKYLGLKAESYISSGLLLMNLDRLREISGPSNIFVRKTLSAVNDGIQLPYPDMDILNSVAAMVPDSVVLLDPSFNLWHNSLHLGLTDLRHTIFHYVSKPGKAFFPAHLLFWKYYAMSPFAGDMFERMSAAYTSSSMEFVKYYATRPRHRRHAVELLKYGLAGMLLRAVGRKLGLVKK